ncbi:MAG: hypothetical protein DMD57_13050 [Gemmatimonadetes bacterium]|nr:MAG: hypothetical protein DMD57_13050 [Gemmatimonadota bacterium]
MSGAVIRPPLQRIDDTRARSLRYALRSSRRFRNHLEIAYGSAVETSELLELAIRKQILPEALSHAALESCQRCQRLLLGLIKRYRDNEA